MSNGVNSFWLDYKEFMYNRELDDHIEDLWDFLEEQGRVDSYSSHDLEEARNEAAEEAYEIGREDGYDGGYESGYDDGHYEGTDEGYAKGKLHGYEEGYEAAKEKNVTEL